MSSEPKQQIEDGILAQTPCKKQKNKIYYKKTSKTPFRSVYPFLQNEKAWHLLGFFYIFCLDVRGEFRISST